MADRYKLVYFNSRGRAELIRYIFAYAGIKYHDFRFEFEEWERFIPHTAFKDVPVLEVNDDFYNKFELTGQLPICRFLAHRFSLCGGSEENRASADMIVHQIVSLFEKFSVIDEYETNEEKKREQFALFIHHSLPDYLDLLEAFVARRGSSFLVNNNVCWADLALAAFFGHFGRKKDTLLSPYKRLKDIDTKVNNLPQIVQLKQTYTQSVKFAF